MAVVNHTDKPAATQYRTDTRACYSSASEREARPMPDRALVDIQTAVDWIARARPGDAVMVEKKSNSRYYVKQYRRDG